MEACGPHTGSDARHRAPVFNTLCSSEKHLRTRRKAPGRLQRQINGVCAPLQLLQDHSKDQQRSSHGNEQYIYEVNRERTSRRNPSTSVTPATVREREDNGTLFYGRGGGEVPPDRSNSTQILIVAYIRSGSSLTGDILQQDPDSFYVYEPLHFTEKNGAKIHRVQLLNGEVVDIGRKHFFDRAFTVINSYFDCDFARLDFGTLVHGFQTFGNKTNKFIKCYVNKTGQKIQKKLAAQICGVQLQDSCQRSKFRTIKTIRIPMMHVETLLQRYPNLKVIHLVRDPRAQVNSIDLLAKTTKYNKGFARQKCTAMNKDFYFSEQYRSRYPGRIMRLYYEDLASNPIKLLVLFMTLRA